jgi:hypothetical protein
MQAANQALFDDPDQYQRLKAIASGVSKSGILGGMTFVTEDKVRAGEMIYRIGHSTMPMTLNMSSPWWMRDSTFEHIKSTTEAVDGDLQELYRIKCAVSYDFGVADIILRARLKQTLRAFAGRGRPVVCESEGQRGQAWFGAIEIAQLFIPGLRDFERGVPTPLCHASLEILETSKIASFIRVQRRREKKARKLAMDGR